MEGSRDFEDLERHLQNRAAILIEPPTPPCAAPCGFPTNYLLSTAKTESTKHEIVLIVLSLCPLPIVGSNIFRAVLFIIVIRWIKYIVLNINIFTFQIPFTKKLFYFHCKQYYIVLSVLVITIVFKTYIVFQDTLVQLITAVIVICITFGRTNNYFRIISIQTRKF